MRKIFTALVCLSAMCCINAAEILSEKDTVYWIWFDSSRSHAYRRNPGVTTADMCLYGAFNMAEVQHHNGNVLSPDASNGITELHVAALTGNYSVIERYKSLANTPDIMGRTPIFYAKNRRTIELLIENGAAASPTDKYGFTPLFMARSRECAEALIEKGCSVKARSRSGNTPLHITGNKEVASYLCRKGADVIAKNANGETPLHIQVKYEDDSEIVEWLIITVDKNVVVRDNDGNTALHYATHRKWAELMYYRNNNIINVKNNKGETPIFTTPSVEIGRFLIEKGCDLKLRSYPQWDATPLHTAKNAEMVDLLVQYIDVNSATSYGYTPLHSTDNLNVAKALIRNGANLNAQLKNGQTPLHIHVCLNPDIALLLVEKGADVNIKTIYGFTPLFDVRDPELAGKIASKADPDIKVQDHYTALLWHIVKADYPNNIERGRIVREIIAGCPEMATISTGWNYTPLHCVQDVETAEALLNAGADINYLSAQKTTPLHCQIKDGHYNVARYLIDKGAKLNERDIAGKTPLDYCGDKGLQEYMKSKGAE